MGDPAPVTFTTVPSDIAKADVAELVENLTTDEAISLTAGVGVWHTHEVPRLGIPAVKVCNNVFLIRFHTGHRFPDSG
jgi:beta-glucosidase